MNTYKTIVYSLAVGAWNTILSGMLITIMNLVRSISHSPLITLREGVTMWIIGFIILFVFNLKLVDD